MNKRAAIPVLRSGNDAIDRTAESVKQTLDAMTGQQKNAEPLSELPATATLAELIARFNVVVRRLQGE